MTFFVWHSLRTDHLLHEQALEEGICDHLISVLKPPHQQGEHDDSSLLIKPSIVCLLLLLSSNPDLRKKLCDDYELLMSLIKGILVIVLLCNSLKQCMIKSVDVCVCWLDLCSLQLLSSLTEIQSPSTISLSCCVWSCSLLLEIKMALFCYHNLC